MLLQVALLCLMLLFLLKLFHEVIHVHVVCICIRICIERIEIHICLNPISIGKIDIINHCVHAIRSIHVVRKASQLCVRYVVIRLTYDPCHDPVLLLLQPLT